MSSHSRNADLNAKNVLEDLTQKGSWFQSEHVLGTKDCLYELVLQKGMLYIEIS